ncbi:MAG: DUF192 domain-containing protein [bacterium]|nr:DUF192 domain-containing protein [bacterium]
MADLQNDLILTSENGESVKCRLAGTFLTRFIGFMGQKPPQNRNGLLIRPCNSIHMFFMRFAIDVVFLDKEFNIVKLVRNLMPGKIVGAVSDAHQVLEVRAGDLPDSFSEGARLTASST